MNAEHLAEARRMGVEAAKAAASWTVDGNMTQDHIARMIRWLDDGDPRADNYLPNCPNLSGEWADDPTPMSLYREITGRDPDDPADGLAFETLHGCMIDALADAWEAGVSDTFMQECERELRAALSADA